VRIEHPQQLINQAQYGAAAAHPALGAADYKMAVHLPNGRSVYTFCMCPGGQVVCAASEQGGICVNGMSNHARDGQNANSAVLVGVDPSDYGSDDVLAGIDFQRGIERRAFEAALAAGAKPYQAPAQTVGDFLATAAMRDMPLCDGFTNVQPTYARGVVACDLHDILPAFICDALAQGLPLLDKKLKGFANPGAVLTGVETRSSSPVRIVRNDDYQASIAGLYPAGEGAGYAGGIMSSAIDGLRIGLHIIQKAQIAQASAALRSGLPALLATDTVYGLGVAVRYAETPQVLFTLKHRPPEKSVAWLVAGIEALDEFGQDVQPYAYELAKQHWPGALTLVVKASAAVPVPYASPEGTIGLRMPDSAVALQLMRECGSPLATSSANISGQPSVAFSTDIAPELLVKVPALVADDSPKSGIASTVIDCTGPEPVVLRQGAITL